MVVPCDVVVVMVLLLLLMLLLILFLWLLLLMMMLLLLWNGCVMIWDLKKCKSSFPALQWWYFGHNSFDFVNWLMGLDVLESLFYSLSTLCYEFLHLKCRKIVNRV